jgi:hypothetical protein
MTTRSSLADVVDDVKGEPNSNDSKQNLKAAEIAIESLARETHADIELVRSLYEHEHNRLASQAKIRTYLPVITARIVRMTLQSESATQIQ